MKDLNDGISPQMTSKEYQKVTNGYVGEVSTISLVLSFKIEFAA